MSKVKKALDRIRRLISDVKGYKMTYLHQMYNPQDHNPDDIKNYILRQLRVFFEQAYLRPDYGNR